jgi:hypothetical protein
MAMPLRKLADSVLATIFAALFLVPVLHRYLPRPLNTRWVVLVLALAVPAIVVAALVEPIERWQRQQEDRQRQKAVAAFEAANNGIRERQKVFSPEEFDRRRAVWESMSDLFLDTENRWDIPYIALRLVESGYTVNKLDVIWQREAVPEFFGNLIAIFGEWAGIRPDEARLLKRAVRRPPLVSFWWWHPFYWALTNEWRQVKAFMALLGTFPEAERRHLCHLANRTMRHYLDDMEGDAYHTRQTIQTIRETGFSRERVDSLIDNDLLPMFQRLLIGAERANPGQRAQRVTAVIAEAFKGNQDRP